MSDQLPIDPADIQMNMTEISACERRLVFDIPTRLAKRFQKKLKKTGQDASAEATTHHLINFCVEQGLKRFELNPIWGPIPTVDVIKPMYKSGSPFTLSVDVDDRPELDWPDFSTLEIVRPVREITDEMIDAEMGEQCRDAGIRKPLQGNIESNDEIICHVTLSEKGSDTPLYTQEKTTLRIPTVTGTSNIFGIPIDGICEKIVGSKVGQAIAVETQVPDEYTDPTLRGDTVVVELMIQEAYRIEPASIEEVITQYGSPSEAILRQQIRLALESKAKRDQQSAISYQVFQQLSEQFDIPLPSWVIKQFHDSIADNVRNSMKQHGCSDEAISLRIEEQEERISALGTELAKKRAITNLLGRHLGVQTDEGSIIAQIAEMAAEQGRRPEELRKEIMESGKIKSVAIIVMERKSVDVILEQASVTDMPAEEWIAKRKSTV